MEVVTLAYVTLNRVGSAQNHGVMAEREVSVVREVSDESSATLMELVKTVAEENGEPRAHLHALKLDPGGWRSHPQKGTVVFNVQGLNMQYGSPYAVCLSHPALKVDGRYFKLEEIAV